MLMGVGALALLLVAGGAVFLLQRGGTSFTEHAGADSTRSSGGAPSSASPAFPSPSPVPTVAPIVPFTAADAHRISTALASPDSSTAASVLVPEVRVEFLRAGVRAVPPGSTVTVLTDRFEAVRPDFGSVPVVVSGPESGRFVALLLYEQGQWLVATTQEVQ